MAGNILIVDDEKSICDNLREFFSQKGFEARVARDGRTALKTLQENLVEMVLLDLYLPDMEGLEVLERIKTEYPDTGVVMFTANADIGVAVKAMQLKADNFVTKPIDLNVLEAIVEKCRDKYQIQNELYVLKHKISRIEGGTHTLRKNQFPADLVKTIKILSEKSSVDVLILGETGSGKSFLADLIHKSSDRKDQPFIEINCAELGGQLLESELFGHEKGAFTDAREAKRGLLEVADGGTVFLDEVGEMSLSVQAKLLKVIEKKSFRRVGGIANLSVDIRFMVATNTDLEKAVKEKRFRKDLYYRLNVVPIKIPPLRERRRKILHLSMVFLEEFRRKFSKKVTGFGPGAEKALGSYDWPGNIRELRNVIERGVLICSGSRIERKHLPEPLQSQRPSQIQETPYKGTLSAVEKQYIEKVLNDCRFNQSRTARVLGIHRSTLIKKIKEFKLQRPSS